MLDNIELQRVFSNQEIGDLRKMFAKAHFEPLQRWDNITNVFVHVASPDDVLATHFAKKIATAATAFTSKKWKLYDCFLLEYHPGGKADIHMDQHATEGGVSIVTLIDQDGLQGGDVLIASGGNIDVIDLKVGESVFYNAAIQHGVSEVTAGYRQVFVTWLNPDEE